MYFTQQKLIHDSLQREIYQIEKLKNELLFQRRKISSENLLIETITDLINNMTKKRSPSKRTMDLKIKQNTKIS